MRELEHYVEGLPEFVYWRRGRCLAYGNTSYSALADAIKAQCEILEDDAADVAVEEGRRRRSIELFGDDALAPHIRALVGAGEAGSFSREDLFEAWRRFLERLAARYPLVLVLEDVHWADDGLLDFIEHAADWAQGPIMLRHPRAARAVRDAAGMGRRQAERRVDLPRPALGGRGRGDARGPARRRPRPRSCVRAIVERSEGNPLYVEEIVRKLIDDGVLRATEAPTVGGRAARRRRRAAALDPGVDRGAARRAARTTRRRCCRTPPWSAGCSGPARSPRSPAGPGEVARHARPAPREGAGRCRTSRRASPTSRSSRSATT